MTSIIVALLFSLGKYKPRCKKDLPQAESQCDENAHQVSDVMSVSVQMDSSAMIANKEPKSRYLCRH